MKKLSLFAIFALLASAAFAVVATPEPIVRTLPDGTTQTVYLRGDEHFHYLTTLDGQIIEGTSFGEQLSAPERQRKAQALQLSSFVPSKGTVHIPVILLNFSDLAFSIDDPVAKFDDLFNGNGGSNPNATGSVKDYYLASSDSALNLVYHVYGPYTLSNTQAYYGRNQGSNTSPKARQVVEEAAQLAEAAGVNFSQFDNNNDGYIDNLSIIVAGYNEAEGGSSNTLWPHYSQVSSSTRYSGKYLSGYLMISEYRGGSGQVQAGIGTYCHEFGHALGLADLYDTSETDSYTIGSWDVMCNGSYNNRGCTPPTYTAFERFWMGWMTPVQLSTNGDYTLFPTQTHNQAYLIAAQSHNLIASAPSPSEYFLIENRQALGWDANKDALINTGLLISHITFNYTNWTYNTFNNQTPLGYAIVSAGNPGATSSTAADVFPGSKNVLQFTPVLNSGRALSAQSIRNIRVNDDHSISFTFGAISQNSLALSAHRQDTLITAYDQGIVSYDSITLSLQSQSLSNDTLLFSLSHSQFEYRLDTDTAWTRGNTTGTYILGDKALSTPQRLCASHQTELSSATLTTTIHIRYRPTRQVCPIQTATFTAQTKDKQRAAQYTLYGIAPRPTYITEPTILPVTDLTSTSFAIHWDRVNDAEGYLISLSKVDANGNQSPIYQGDDFLLDSTSTQAIFMDLEPETSYTYTVTAFEEKGCARNVLSSPAMHISTLSSAGALKPILIQRDAQGQYTATLPETTDGKTRLNIYNYLGQLVSSTKLPYATLTTTIDTQSLQAGQIYILRLYKDGMSRQGVVGKMLYY